MEGRRSTGRVPWPGTLSWLQILLVVALLMLVAQYVLGMIVAIYLAPPYGTSDFLFNLHYSLGILDIAVGLAVLTVSVLTYRHVPLVTSLAAFVAVLGAGQAGRMFAFSGLDPFYSLLMSLGFVAAFVLYFLALMSVRSFLSTAGLEAPQALHQS